MNELEIRWITTASRQISDLMTKRGASNNLLTDATQKGQLLSYDKNYYLKVAFWSWKQQQQQQTDQIKC